MAYSKGQIITMNLDGTNREYRILKLDGNIAEVVAMFEPNTSCMFNGNGANTYSGGDLDTYLNTTWYGGLTTTAKNALVSKTLTQYQYTYKNSVYNETTHASWAGYSTKSVKASGLSRKVYALDVEDIENYFNRNFSTADIWELFWNVRSKPTTVTYPWLRSADAELSDFAWCVDGGYGRVLRFPADSSCAARPALTIDLSKIPPTSINIYLNNTLTEVTYAGTNKWANASISGKTLTFPTSDTTYIDGRELFSTSGGTQRSVSGQDGIVENGYYVYDDSTWLDLTTLDLAIGTHTITVKATAINFRDSNFSNEVSYTVEPPREAWILNDSQDRLLTDSENLYLECKGKQLATPQNVTAVGTTVSWDEVENATSYAVLADGSEIGTVEAATTDELAGTWVFNQNPDLSGSGAIDVNINFTSNQLNFANMLIIKGSIPSGAIQYGEYQVYSLGIGWDNEAYKTIAITSKLSEVTDGETLLAWLQANATKQSTTTPILITFTISGISYQAEEGMTWGEWVESSYNTISSTVAPDGKITYPPNGSGNYVGLTDNSDNDKVVSTDIIVAQMQYYGQNPGGQ